MRLWPLVLAALGVIASAVPRQKATDDWVVLVGGDTDGYLAPCGCTKPMTGGIQRRASAIATFRGTNTLILENGGLVAGTGRQDELKAEAMAQFLGAIDADAVHVTPSEARLGKGELLSLANLAGDRLVSTSLGESDLPVRPFMSKGPFVVGGVSMNSAALSRPLEAAGVSPESAVTRLIDEAEQGGKKPILLLSGSLADAQSMAQRNPELALVVYRATGTPTEHPTKEGKVWLVSPGDKGKFLLRLGYRDGFLSYTAHSLGPEYKNEAATQRAYRAYLRRLDDENLLDKLPRSEGPLFAGTQKCGTCHEAAMKAWKGSGHAIALKSLENEGHGRDPDCVRCHVVGLQSVHGFASRQKTPQLANVGCESCHGPGAAHAASPQRTRFPKVTEKNCVSCHDPENSPGFDFLTYWRRIRH